MRATPECTSVQTVGIGPDAVSYCAVGCRVHHLMPDGCAAAEHEVRCDSCGEFKCDHECGWYHRTDEGEREEILMCHLCGRSSETWTPFAPA